MYLLLGFLGDLWNNIFNTCVATPIVIKSGTIVNNAYIIVPISDFIYLILNIFKCANNIFQF